MKRRLGRLEPAAIADRPILVSEFGGIGLSDAPGAWGYAMARDADDLVARYAAQCAALHASEALSGFCYTQLTDTAQETNGLFTVNREPKFDVERLRVINSRPSKAVPSEILDVMIKQEVERRRRERGAVGP